MLLHVAELGVESGFHAGHDVGEGGLGDDGLPSRGEDSRRGEAGEDSRRAPLRSWGGDQWHGVKEGTVDPVAAAASPNKRSSNSADASSQGHIVSSVLRSVVQVAVSVGQRGRNSSGHGRGGRASGEASAGGGSISSQYALVIGEVHERGEGVVGHLSGVSHAKAHRLVVHVPGQALKDVIGGEVAGSLAEVAEQTLQLVGRSRAKSQHKVLAVWRLDRESILHEKDADTMQCSSKAKEYDRLWVRESHQEQQ